MQFESDGESVQILGQEAVNHISEMTDTDPDAVIKTLLYRTVATGGGEVIEKGHEEQDACFGRDAFAKVSLPNKTCSCKNDFLGFILNPDLLAQKQNKKPSNAQN